MDAGRKNIIAGGIAIILRIIGGFTLGFSLEPYFKGGVEEGFYAMTYGRTLLRAGHTHGLPFAFYNLIIGLMIDRLALSDSLKKWCSILTVLALIMPVGLVLRGITAPEMTFVPVVMLGSICFFSSVVIMIIGAIKSSNKEQQ